jgi:hypothetical protein
MKVRYFEDTDTLYIEFRDSGIAESKDLDENTVLDVDGEGNVCVFGKHITDLGAGIPCSGDRSPICIGFGGHGSGDIRHIYPPTGAFGQGLPERREATQDKGEGRQPH